MTQEEIREQFEKVSEADWVRRMKEHYAETGCYRPEDLRRLLGDPTRSVDMRPRSSVPAYFLQQ
jgi:hypothetical protein